MPFTNHKPIRSSRVLAAISVIVFLFSLLAVFRAPAMVFWLPAIVATEWGHDLALFCVLLLSLPKRFVRQAAWSRGLLLIATILFISPLIRSFPVAHRLPSQLLQAFGPIDNGLGPLPIRLKELFLGLNVPEVTPKTISYATYRSKPLLMDVYTPPRAGSYRPPLILIVHGGSWKGGDRTELPRLSQALADRGYTIASVDYRLAPEYTFPAPRDDIFKAMAYLDAHADDLGWDGKHMAILGRSAGGQIALAAAYASKDPALKGVIAYYTPNDLIFGYSLPSNPWIMDSRKVLSTYLGGSPDQVPQVWRDASPLFAVNAKTPPTLLIHGGRDELVWPIHDLRLGARLEAAHRPYYYLALPWGTHACDANLSGPSGQLSLYALDYFLKVIFKS